MPGVHAKIRQADKGLCKYLLCPQDFIMKCLSEQSQRAAQCAAALPSRIRVPVTQSVFVWLSFTQQTYI